jgi:hypothetical protein
MWRNNPVFDVNKDPLRLNMGKSKSESNNCPKHQSFQVEHWNWWELRRTNDHSWKLSPEGAIMRLLLLQSASCVAIKRKTWTFPILPFRLCLLCLFAIYRRGSWQFLFILSRFYAALVLIIKEMDLRLDFNYSNNWSDFVLYISKVMIVMIHRIWNWSGRDIISYVSLLFCWFILCVSMFWVINQSHRP